MLEKAIEMYENGMDNFFDTNAPLATSAIQKHGEMARHR